jgi:hypothetical protein
MVRRSLWSSERFSALPDDAARYLYIYLLTCPHQTSSGCFVLKEAYALADLHLAGSDWTASKYQKAKAALIASGLIIADDATDEILILRWWKDNGPNNDSWFMGAQRQCEAIKSNALRTATQEALGVCWQEFLASKLPSTPRGPNEFTHSPDATERLSTLRNRRVAP